MLRTRCSSYLLRSTSRITVRSYATATRSSIRRDAYIFVGLASITAAVWYYQQSSSVTNVDIDGLPVSTKSGSGNTFKITVGSKGQEHTFQRKPVEEQERMLHEHETGKRIGRRGNPVVRWDSNWVGSNEPCEDRAAVDNVPRSRGATEMVPWWKFWSQSDTTPRLRVEGDRDIALFSIIDGHAGDATSKLLTKTLHPTLTLSLAALQAGQAASPWKAIIDTLKPLAGTNGSVWSPTTVSTALQQAFTTLDENICFNPVRLIPSVSADPKPNELTPQTWVALAEPANSGACAISTVVDAEHNDLYVALLGDCRAVAGWQDSQGQWRSDTLSEDQMGENPREIERMQSEHPASENDTVIQRGRVQGGLQPTRAFGDAVYKWNSQQFTAIKQMFESENVKVRSQRPTNLTPPYVTARPEVTHRPLSTDHEKLRFVIMATDGLWDRITSEEATLLVASYLAHRTHPDISKTQLPSDFPLAPPISDRPYPAQDLPGSPSRSAGSWVFEGDKNAATHLIRNSLAGGDRKLRGELLSMHGKVTRWVRDDITVTVIFFDDGVDARSLGG